MNIQDRSSLGLTRWISLQPKGLSAQGTAQDSQHCCSKVSILRCSAFFIVQLSHPYMTTGKTIALTRQTFVGKVMSLLFNMLSRDIPQCNYPSPLKGRLGCFLIWQLQTVLLQTFVHRFWCEDRCLFHLGRYPGVGLCGPHGECTFTGSDQTRF